MIESTERRIDRPSSIHPPAPRCARTGLDLQEHKYLQRSRFRTSSDDCKPRGESIQVSFAYQRMVCTDFSHLLSITWSCKAFTPQQLVRVREPSFMENRFRIWVLRLAAALWFSASLGYAQLTNRFYDKYGSSHSGCYNVESKIWSVVDDYIDDDPTTAAGLLRMQFHDCFVRGCDSSVLIVSNATNTAERDGFPNINSLRGFEVIDAAKAAVESVCPGKVSCADIIALAARDALQMISGIYWQVNTGRRDGTISLASDANSNLPPPTFNLSQLTQSFANKGFTQKEMIVLSGAHKIGFTHCIVIQGRLYNFTGPGAINGTDPSLDPAYAAYVKNFCPFGTLNKRIPLDPNNGTSTFNSDYFTSLLAGKVLFISDAALNTDSNSTAVVTQEGQFTFYPFFTDFANAMVKMSTISVLTGTQGEIRSNCSAVN